ncbi:MAG: class III poly(R)-hydroxyalkanoic acid synthase subunit PhaC [Chloroflexales bacterium]|nr:class III poly(R)-hydroxyalkanoic acid synthase subunit PhaC [Chloroflexales bacterium]
MSTFPMQLDAIDVLHELTEMNRKLVQGMRTLGRLHQDDIQVGTTPKEPVYQEDKLVLYRYTPVVEQPFPIPLLIVYALVNRPSVADLQPDRSLVRNLLAQGLDVYLVDWGYPTRADRYLTLEDYIAGYIDTCVDVIRERHGLDKINLLGICQGGTFSACYAALYPKKVQNLTVMVAPIDFHATQDGKNALLNMWGLGMDVDQLVDATGNIPGELMNFGFVMLKPLQLNFQKYVDLLEVMGDEGKLLNFLRMEEWIFDSPDLAGEAFRQFVKEFFHGNKLVKGEAEIGGRRVDLRNLTMPVLNIYAEQDHLVPPPSSIALGQYVGTADYTLRAFPVGHIGMYVSGKAQRDLAPTIAEWVKARLP